MKQQPQPIIFQTTTQLKKRFGIIAADMGLGSLETSSPKPDSRSIGDMPKAIDTHNLESDSDLFKDGPFRAKKDHLTSLLLEVPFLILVEVPIADCLEVVQKSKVLREFVRTNAARFCNPAIFYHFPPEAVLILSKTINGWIAPSHHELPVLEGYIIDRKEYDDRARGFSTEEEIGARGLDVKLTSPATQYLMWLQASKAMKPKSTPDDNGNVEHFNKRNMVALLKQPQLVSIRQNVNKAPNGLWQQELIWCYGVPENGCRLVSAVFVDYHIRETRQDDEHIRLET